MSAGGGLRHTKERRGCGGHPELGHTLGLNQTMVSKRPACVTVTISTPRQSVAPTVFPLVGWWTPFYPTFLAIWPPRRATPLTTLS